MTCHRTGIGLWSSLFRGLNVALGAAVAWVSAGCGNGVPVIGESGSAITSSRQAGEALMAMADTQMAAYAKLLEILSDDGTKSLFDATVQIDEADYDALVAAFDAVLAAEPGYQEAAAYLEGEAARIGPGRAMSQRAKLGDLLQSVGTFFGWVKGQAERRREDILTIAVRLTEEERQAMFNTAKDLFPAQDVGDSAETFFTKLGDGELDGITSGLHREFAHNSTDIPHYGQIAQEANRRPIDIAAFEGAKGLEAGADVVAQGSLGIICARFPQFCEGVTKAQEVYDKLEEIGEDPVGFAGEQALDKIKEQGQEFLEERLGDALGQDVDLDKVAENVERVGTAVRDARDIADAVRDRFGTVTTNMDDGSGDGGESDDDVDLVALSAPGGERVILVVPEGGTEMTDGGTGDEEFVVPPGGYDVTVVGRTRSRNGMPVEVGAGGREVITVEPAPDEPTDDGDGSNDTGGGSNGGGDTGGGTECGYVRYATRTYSETIRIVTGQVEQELGFLGQTSAIQVCGTHSVEVFDAGGAAVGSITVPGSAIAVSLLEAPIVFIAYQAESGLIASIEYFSLEAVTLDVLP